MEYNGYTIEIDKDRTYNMGHEEYIFYKTDEGIQHDGDFDGQDWHYCGNCKWAGSIEDAKDQIDEMNTKL